MNPFVDSTLAAAIQRLDRACRNAEEHPAMNHADFETRHAVMVHVLVAREHLTMLQELIEVERELVAEAERRKGTPPTNLRVIK